MLGLRSFDNLRAAASTMPSWGRRLIFLDVHRVWRLIGVEGMDRDHHPVLQHCQADALEVGVLIR